MEREFQNQGATIEKGLYIFARKACCTDASRRRLLLADLGDQMQIQWSIRETLHIYSPNLPLRDFSPLCCVALISFCMYFVGGNVSKILKVHEN